MDIFEIDFLKEVEILVDEGLELIEKLQKSKNKK